jgi:hypothetical protein
MLADFGHIERTVRTNLDAERLIHSSLGRQTVIAIVSRLPRAGDGFYNEPGRLGGQGQSSGQQEPSGK